MKILIMLIVLIFVGCDKQKNKISEDLDLDAKNKGETVYYANCITCHNTNPKKQGSIGPAIHGSSIELLSLKMKYGKYPNNYSPKRTTRIMPIMKQLEKDIRHLYAFLN